MFPALLFLAAAAVSADPPPVPLMPAAAGLCSGDAGVGVGCSFDASRMTALGLTIAPKKAVLHMAWCPEACYATCPPSLAPECSSCQCSTSAWTRTLTSRVLYAYGRDPRQAADMTDAAGDLLPLCSMDGVDCRSMGSIVDYVRRFYCHLFSTKAGDCAT